MPEIILPDVSLRWAQGGDILKPSDAKIQSGWGPEIPPRQWFNWLDNRQDEAIAHIAQHGIAVWSPNIEYQANKSFVQGSNGVIYKAITTNIDVNPVNGLSGNWESAFLTSDQAVQVATAAQSRARAVNNVYISPSQLNNAFNTTGSAPFYAVRAWANIDGRSTTPAIRGSGNIATVTRVSTGVFDVTFSTPMPTANYSVISSGCEEMISGPGTNQDVVCPFNLTVNGFRIHCFATDTQLNNLGVIFLTVIA